MSLQHFVKMQVGITSQGNFIYPVPIEAIKLPKYRSDNLECAAILEYEPPPTSGLEIISQQEYEEYGQCIVTVDKKKISADGSDTCEVTVKVPCNDPVEVILWDGESEVLDFDDSDEGIAVFELKSSIPKIWRLRASCNLFPSSNEVLVKAE